MKRRKGLMLVFMTGITLMMGICFSGCNQVDVSKIVEKDAPDMIELAGWGDSSMLSGIWYNQFTVNQQNGDIFICNDDSGGLHYGTTQLSCLSQIILHSGETGYWSYDYRDGHTPSKTFIEIVVKGSSGDSLNKYIGYAVIKVINNEDYNYSATVLKSVTFPMVNGEYQEISKEQIDTLISYAKK